ncbi:MAG: O-antigen ligase family protein [Patescibacteria group bacterium]|nr:O-antigen ligase family protein [Patescibacteria group bacterium]
MPTQLAKHFWPDFSYVNGLRIDYLSPAIHLTDILIFALFLSWLFGLFFRHRLVNSKQKTVNKSTFPGFILLFSVLCFLFSVSFFAQNPILSFLKLIKILEFIFLGWFVSQKVTGTAHHVILGSPARRDDSRIRNGFWTRFACQNDESKIELSTVIFLLSITVFYESFLAVWQFISQGSVGGFWWFLGERTFNSSTPFIAQAVVNGQLILRSYGTFSHPNVLGGYLAMVLALLIFNFQLSIFNFQKHKIKTIFFLLTVFLGLTALFLTFSRTAWVVGAIAILAALIVRARRELKGLNFSLRSKNKFVILFCFSVGLLVFIGTYLTIGNSIFSRFQTLENADQKSLVIREQLNIAAVKMIQHYPFLGVGLNNFLISLPNYYQSSGSVRFLQPVHNIYLLVAAETGLIGLLIFIIFIIFGQNRLLKKRAFLLLLLVGEILVLGLFDHYFWTLQQGELLATLVLGLAWAKKSTV